MNYCFEALQFVNCKMVSYIIFNCFNLHSFTAEPKQPCYFIVVDYCAVLLGVSSNNEMSIKMLSSMIYNEISIRM